MREVGVGGRRMLLRGLLLPLRGQRSSAQAKRVAKPVVARVARVASTEVMYGGPGIGRVVKVKTVIPAIL